MSRNTAAWCSWAFSAGIAIWIVLGAERGACHGSSPDGQQTVPTAAVNAGALAKLPIPSQAARFRANERIKDLFEADFKKATARDAKIALANTLLSHTRDPLDPPSLYAMLDAAHRLATEAGHVATAMAAAQQLAGSFALEEQVLIKQTLKALAAKPLPAEVDALADELQRLANQQFARGEHSDAIDTMQLAVSVLRRGTDRARQKLVLDKLGLMKSECRLLEKSRALEQQLSAAPDDAKVADELGRVLCFEIDDWSRGLLFLAKSPDESLAHLAQLEAAQPRSRVQATGLGDGWTAFAATAKGAAADGALARARHHYALALDGASGLDRLAIEKKIRDSLGKGASATKPVAATGLVMSQPPWIVGGVANNNNEPFSGAIHRIMVFDRAIGEREAFALAKSAHDAP